MTPAAQLRAARPVALSFPTLEADEPLLAVLLDGDHPAALATRGRLQAAGIEVVIGTAQTRDMPVALVVHADSLQCTQVATRVRQARRQLGNPSVWVITARPDDDAAGRALPHPMPRGNEVDMLEFRDRMAAAGLGFVGLDPVRCDAGD